MKGIDTVEMRTHCKVLEAIGKTNHYGKHVLAMDDYETLEQVQALMDVAAYLEPIWESGALNFLQGKVMGSIFFQPSTRTRLGTMISMHKLGGKVMTDQTPLVSSRLATGASLEDELKTWSTYVDILSIRHTDTKVALEAIKRGATVPVISGGLGSYEHPVAGYTDMFTTMMTLGRLDNLNILILGADHASSRVAHSYALGMAKFPGNKIISACDKSYPTPPDVIERLKERKVDFEQVLSPSHDEVYDLMRNADICNLSALINCGPKDPPEAKKAFLDKFGIGSPYYITVEMMEKIKKDTGKTVGIMHPFPRDPLMEMDRSLDTTEFALYWKQMEYAQPARMAMILSQIYATQD